MSTPKPSLIEQATIDAFGMFTHEAFTDVMGGES